VGCPIGVHRKEGMVDMTRHESFKKRVRQRMARSGERYTTARQVLLGRNSDGRREWAAPPETSEDAVRAATGRGWDDWCDLIDSWPRDGWDHPAVAARLQAEHGVDGWWAQAVTVGYERITGLRLPHQRADGTFTAGKSRTVAVDAGALREMLLGEHHRRDLFPGADIELRSRPESKAIRLAVGPGVAVIDLQPRPDGRTRIAVAHERLPTAADVDRWKFWWSDWLEAIDQG